MNRGWTFLRELKNVVLPEPDKCKDYIREIKKAHDEWMAAQNYFENVVDHDLVDYAIYKVEASRRKYMYMLKQAKLNGIINGQLVSNENEEIFS